MASSITITQLSPSVAHFRVVCDAGTPIVFQQSGAVAPDKDLSALSPGPLKEYLNRLANWGPVSDPASTSRVRWRVIQTNDSALTPVVGGTVAVGMVITQSAATAITFSPTGGAGALDVELAFVHSMQR